MEDQEAADSVADHAAVALEADHAEADSEEAQEVVVSEEDREVLCTTDRIITDRIGTDQDRSSLVQDFTGLASSEAEDVLARCLLLPFCLSLFLLYL